MIRLGAEGILANDLDSDLLTAVLVSEPIHGTLTLGESGGFIYIPDINFSGTDAFTYRASDSLQESNEATVNITVEPVDDPPQTQGDHYETEIGVELIIKTSEGVLTNDFDIEEKALTATLSKDASNGILNLCKWFIYIPTGT